MEEVGQQRGAGEYSADASGSDSRENFQESPPLPFPHRFPEFSPSPSRREHYAGMNDEHLMNNEDPSVVREDPKSCFIVSVTFSLFVAMTLAFGLYASETLRLGRNTSMLIKPNHLLVESIKVVELDAAKGSMLYGFSKVPPLDVIKEWSETHKITLPASTHKEWTFYLNEASQINISYSVYSLRPSFLILVIAGGNVGLAKWLEDPSYPNTTLSWNKIHGNGSIQKVISESSTYWIAVGNLNAEFVEVHLNITIRAYLYNTTEPYYKCALSEGRCTFPLYFLGESVAVLTSPGRMPGWISGDWCVKLSYTPRWLTYLVGAGGMTLLLLLITYILNHFQRTDDDTESGETRSERSPLLAHKDDNLSSLDSSYASVSDDEEHAEDAQAGNLQRGEQVRDEESSRRLCAICFDAPRDCFFLPCGHCVACFGCATRIVETYGVCPICRRQTKKVRQIYTV